jgi:hypothetical protein
MSVSFQDGEPVDPLKLQKLQDQITAVSEKANDAFVLGSRLDSQQRQVIFHTKAGVEVFEGGINAGEIKTSPIDLEWGGEYTSVYTVATPRLKDPGKNNIRISFSGDSRVPTMVVWAEKKFTADLYVHWISVATKPIS